MSIGVKYMLKHYQGISKFSWPVLVVLDLMGLWSGYKEPLEQVRAAIVLCLLNKSAA